MCIRDRTYVVSEKSIIRPTFSYLGNFTISDAVFRPVSYTHLDVYKRQSLLPTFFLFFILAKIRIIIENTKTIPKTIYLYT